MPTHRPLAHDDPGRFLHRIDPAARQFIFVATDAERLRGTPFLDGRTTFWDGDPAAVPFDAELGRERLRGDLVRFVFHVSFCGSTLLATLLDEACEALVLKEPHCLVDLADWRKTLQNAAAHDPRHRDVLGYALASLGRRHAPPEPVVVKPSNWVNNLLPQLCRRPHKIRAVFLSMEPSAFLIAVFRGGRERIAFTARACAHLASAFEQGAGLVEEAISLSPEPLERVARLSILAHILQSRLFDAAAARLGCGTDHRFDFLDITQRPEEVLRGAAAALRLRIAEDKLSRALARWQGSNAKAPSVAFSPEARRAEDTATSAQFGQPIRGALDWAASVSEQPDRLRLAEPL